MRWRSMAALMLVAGVAATHAAAAQDTRAAIGVMPFDNGGSYGLESEDFAAFEIGLQQMLITELAVNAELRLVERSRLKGLMEELGRVLGEVIQDSERVKELLKLIEKSGYAANLTLAVVLGPNERHAELRQIIYGKEKTERKTASRRLSAFDKRFLRALRIQMPD